MFDKSFSCTTMLAGKGATMDGSTIIARDEDYFTNYHAKVFTVRPAKDQPNNYYVSKETGVKVPLPSHAYQYTCEPDTYESNPMYEEAGINEKNVAMSSTETTATNAKFLGADPYVEHGINEDAMLTLVLPYVTSAKAGVERLGHLIEKYGTGQSNGIAFADHNDVWYMETAGGHHWVAIKIPDDDYVIAPNQDNIQKIDFDDPQDFMWSKGLKEFVAQHHLNPNPNQFNFRQIAGTHSDFDAHVNTPRAWYGEKMFNPGMAKLGHTYLPTSHDLPFLCHPEHKLSVEDFEAFLSSHYQGTKYDPATNPKELNHPSFRAVGTSSNQISHILQIRNDVPADQAAIEWVAMGTLPCSPYVPFYANIDQTPQNFQTGGVKFTMKSNFWMYKLLAVLVEPHHHQFIPWVNLYRKKCQAEADHSIQVTDQAVKDLTGAELTKALTKHSNQLADLITNQTKALIGKLVKKSLDLSKFTYR